MFLNIIYIIYVWYYREEVERQRKKLHYQKLQAEGKTDEARADLARLAIIKQQRAEAAKKREDEKKGKFFFSYYFSYWICLNWYLQNNTVYTRLYSVQWKNAPILYDPPYHPIKTSSPMAGCHLGMRQKIDFSWSAACSFA